MKRFKGFKALLATTAIIGLTVGYGFAVNNLNYMLVSEDAGAGTANDPTGKLVALITSGTSHNFVGNLTMDGSEFATALAQNSIKVDGDKSILTFKNTDNQFSNYQLGTSFASVSNQGQLIFDNANFTFSHIDSTAPIMTIDNGSQFSMTNGATLSMQDIGDADGIMLDGGSGLSMEQARYDYAGNGAAITMQGAETNTLTMTDSHIVTQNATAAIHIDNSIANINLQGSSSIESDTIALLIEDSQADITLSGVDTRIEGTDAALQLTATQVPSNVNLTLDDQALLVGDVMADSQNDIDAIINASLNNGADWQGNANAQGSNAQINVALDNASWTGMANHDASQDGSVNVTLNNNARWTMTGDSHIGALSLNNSSVDMRSAIGSPTFNTLTTDSLDGNGTFFMRTNIAAEASDRIVANQVSGNHILAINNDGSAATTGHEVVTLVHSNSGDGQFSITNNVELGGYEYGLYERDGLSDSTATTQANTQRDFVLAAVPQNEIIPGDGGDTGAGGDGTGNNTGTGSANNGNTSNNGNAGNSGNWNNGASNAAITSTANAAASFAAAGYMMNYIDNQMLSQRMGNLRAIALNGSGLDGYGNYSAQTGHMNDVWVRGYGGKIDSFSNGKVHGYDMTYAGLQAGIDRHIDMEGKQAYLGVMAGYSDASPDFWQGDGSLKSYNFGVYGTLITDDQFYVDATLKYMHMENEFSVRDTIGRLVTGDADSDGVSLSAEIGKRFTMQNNPGLALTPQLQVSYGHYGSYSTRASNGLHIAVDSMDSVIARLGGTASYDLQTMNNPSQIYASAYYAHEMLGDVDYRLNGSKESYSMEGDWGDFAIGFTTQIKQQHNLYGEIGYSTGDNFDDKRLNAGYRYQF